jgi:MerR family transcriptional regulator, copper efflux regulator
MSVTLRLNADMKSTPVAGLPIGVAAQRYGLAPHVLRHWESEGLLAPARDPAGRRRYGPGDAVRIAVILRGKAAGLTLGTIRTLVTATAPGERRSVLRAEAEALRSKLDAVRASLDLVECALGCAHDDFTQCPHFRDAVGLGP